MGASGCMPTFRLTSRSSSGWSELDSAAAAAGAAVAVSSAAIFGFLKLDLTLRLTGAKPPLRDFHEAPSPSVEGGAHAGSCLSRQLSLPFWAPVTAGAGSAAVAGSESTAMAACAAGVAFHGHTIISSTNQHPISMGAKLEWADKCVRNGRKRVSRCCRTFQLEMCCGVIIFLSLLRSPITAPDAFAALTSCRDPRATGAGGGGGTGHGILGDRVEHMSSRPGRRRDRETGLGRSPGEAAVGETVGMWPVRWRGDECVA